MQADTDSPDRGFAAVAHADARILILGSMPGRRSIDEQQYYAHPHNAFWPIMGELFGFEARLPYAERLDRLKQHRIALWDVAHRCIRPGSLDADIREVEPNDFHAFLSDHPHIRAVFFNGRKAADLFIRLVLPKLPEESVRIERHLLPSTSPAHAAMNRQAKLAAWQIAVKACRPSP